MVKVAIMFFDDGGSGNDSVSVGSGGTAKVEREK